MDTHLACPSFPACVCEVQYCSIKTCCKDICKGTYIHTHLACPSFPACVCGVQYGERDVLDVTESVFCISSYHVHTFDSRDHQQHQRDVGERNETCRRPLHSCHRRPSASCTFSGTLTAQIAADLAAQAPPPTLSLFALERETLPALLGCRRTRRGRGRGGRGG